jgi:hypothetical protein
VTLLQALLVWFLLVAAQLSASLAGPIDLPVPWGDGTFPGERLVYVGSLMAYAGWLASLLRPGWQVSSTAAGVALLAALGTVAAGRPVHQAAVMAAQLGIAWQLWELWSRQHEGKPAVVLFVTAAVHTFMAAIVFPAVQFAAGPEVWAGTGAALSYVIGPAANVVMPLLGTVAIILLSARRQA